MNTLKGSTLSIRLLRTKQSWLIYIKKSYSKIHGMSLHQSIIQNAFAGNKLKREYIWNKIYCTSYVDETMFDCFAWRIVKIPQNHNAYFIETLRMIEINETSWSQTHEDIKNHPHTWRIRENKKPLMKKIHA